MAKINGYNFRIGTDSELWAKSGNKKVSAYGLIPGTKEAPFKVDKGSIQVDGMTLEFNTDPADDEKSFIQNINSVMNILKSIAGDFEVDPVADFGKTYIDAQPAVARKVGCVPDWCAYLGHKIQPPKAPEDYRTAGGHIHISWKSFDNPNWPSVIDPTDESHLKACIGLAKKLDLYLGIPSLAWDTNHKRRETYGKAGRFRPKTYGNGWHGMEYRTLSNAWLNPKYINFLTPLVYNNTLEAIKDLFDNFDDVKKGYGVSVADIINNSSKEEYNDHAARILGSGTPKSAKWYREKYAA